jgi:hypothetical protein
MTTLENDFGRHVVRSTYYAHARLLAQRQFGIENCAETKVSKLEIAAAGQKQIFRFDIAVHEALGVDVAQSKDHLTNNKASFVFPDPEMHEKQSKRGNCPTTSSFVFCTRRMRALSIEAKRSLLPVAPISKQRQPEVLLPLQVTENIASGAQIQDHVPGARSRPCTPQGMPR